MRVLAFFVVTVLFVLVLILTAGCGKDKTTNPPAADTTSTSLDARRTSTAPTIDGSMGDAVWQGPAVLTFSTTGGANKSATTMKMKALYDSTYIYILAWWDDSTKSVDKKQWTKGSWTQNSREEDRLAIMWDKGVTNFGTQGCLALCHSDGMRTAASGETADEWHWKAARSNPIGFLDDKSLDNTFTVGNDEAAHKSDTGTSSVSDNIKMGSGFPTFMAQGGHLATQVDFLYESGTPNSAAGTFATSASFDSTKSDFFSTGYKIPGYVLRTSTGSRGDIVCAGRHTGTGWVLEIKRRLDTGNADDIAFGTSQTYKFGVATMDNAGPDHAYSQVQTLKFLP